MRYYYIIREYDEDSITKIDYHFKNFDKAKEKFIEILNKALNADPIWKEEILEDFQTIEHFYRECWRNEQVDDIVSLTRFTFEDDEREEK